MELFVPQQLEQRPAASVLLHGEERGVHFPVRVKAADPHELDQAPVRGCMQHVAWGVRSGAWRAGLPPFSCCSLVIESSDLNALLDHLLELRHRLNVVRSEGLHNHGLVNRVWVPMARRWSTIPPPFLHNVRLQQQRRRGGAAVGAPRLRCRPMHAGAHRPSPSRTRPLSLISRTGSRLLGWMRIPDSCKSLRALAVCTSTPPLLEVASDPLLDTIRPLSAFLFGAGYELRRQVLSCGAMTNYPINRPCALNKP